VNGIWHDRNIDVLLKGYDFNVVYTKFITIVR